MTRQVKGAILSAVVAAAFVALQLIFDVQTGVAGVFVMGVAGGLFIGDQMAKSVPRSPPA
jgi:hypothetical protein